MKSQWVRGKLSAYIIVSMLLTLLSPVAGASAATTIPISDPTTLNGLNTLGNSTGLIDSGSIGAKVVYNADTSIPANMSSPIIISVSVPSDGTYESGQYLLFNVKYDQTVIVTGTPSLPLTIGNNSVSAAYLSGSGSDVLKFRYLIQESDSDLDGITVGSSLFLNGGSIANLDGNTVASLTLNGVGSTARVIISPATASVSTTAVSNVTSISATVGGNVTSEGGASVTERGMVYSKSSNPTIADNRVIDTGTTGNYTSNLTGLEIGTTYHVRAFVTNSVGTSYGNDVSFTTKLPAPQNVQVIRVTDTSITLEWEAVVGVNQDGGYLVWYGNGGYATWTGTTSATISNLNPNKSYSFYITAITSANEKSVLVTAKTGEENLNEIAAPQNLRILEVSETKIKVQWDPVVGYPDHWNPGYDIKVNNSPLVWGNGAGPFVIEGLTPGTDYQISVRIANRNPLKTALFSDVLTVTTQQKLGSVTGTVLGMGNSPLSGASVAIDLNSVVTDAKGQFTLSNVAPGSQTVTVSSAEYNTEIVNVTATAGQSVSTGPIILTAIQKLGSVTGTVYGIGNSPLSGASVSIGGGSVTTDSQGKFMLNKVVPGIQTVTVSKAGYNNRTVTVTVTAEQSISTGIITLSAVTTTPPTEPTAPLTPINPEPSLPVDPLPTGADVFNSGIIDIPKLTSFLTSKVREANQSSGSLQFSDTNGHWAEPTLLAFMKLGIIQGYGKGEFKPNADISRAEFAALMVRTFNIHLETAADSSFTDITGHWGRDDILRIAQAGVIKGYTDSTFQPDQAISREEMVIILTRILNFSSISKDSSKGNFSDLSSSFGEKEIKEAAQAGIINGRTDKKFQPKSNATRAEVLMIIMNILKLDPELKSLLDSLK